MCLSRSIMLSSLRYLCPVIMIGLLLCTDLSASQTIHPSIGLSSPDLPQLRAKATTSHQEIWLKIKAYADSQMGTVPPSESELPQVNSSIPWRNYGNRVIPFAFSYLITGDTSYSELAKAWILGMCEWSYWGPKFQNDGDIGAAHILYGVSIGYDWLYDQLTEEERSFIREKVAYQANILWQYATGQRDTFWTDAYRQNHNHISNVSLGIAGLVFGEESANASDWQNQAIQNIHLVDDAFSGVTDGSYHEGYNYWTYTMTYLLLYMDLCRDWYELDLFSGNEWLKNSVYFRLYGMMPDPAKALDIADSQLVHRSPSDILRKIAAEYNNGYAEWIVQMRGTDNSTSSAMMSPWEFLWYDPDIEAKPPADLPLSWHFSDWGVVVMRSGWTENDTYLSFKSGAPGGKYGFEQVKNGIPGSGSLGAGHNDPDQNSFTVFAAGEYLATDNGAYYQPKRSISQNTILINNRGQIGEGQEFNQNHPEFWDCPGKIVLFENTESSTYVVGDASNSYPSSSGLKRFIRRIFFVRPDLFVIVDHLEAGHRVRYNWILRNQYGKFEIHKRNIKSIVNGSALQVFLIEPLAYYTNVIPDKKGYTIFKLNKMLKSTRGRFVTVMRPLSEGNISVERLKSLSNDIGLRITESKGSTTILIRDHSAHRRSATSTMKIGGYKCDGAAAIIKSDHNSSIREFTLIRGKKLIDYVNEKMMVSSNEIATIEVKFNSPQEMDIEYHPLSQKDSISPVSVANNTLKEITKVTVNNDDVSFIRTGNEIRFFEGSVH